ncbi:hypothetical protein GQ44DRAFT_708592 [Phaeosphaeriaceae sp. PMI808]|nr:hypothetical protein GQ44DRAFT_708592 [Phaeosphaeriaceae sp. PMI808]
MSIDIIQNASLGFTLFFVGCVTVYTLLSRVCCATWLLIATPLYNHTINTMPSSSGSKTVTGFILSQGHGPVSYFAQAIDINL